MRRSFILLAAISACGEEAAPGPCEEFGEQTDSGCAGVNLSSMCGERFCIPDDAVCKATLFADDDAKGNGSESEPFGDLAQAASAATAGDCVAIAEGTYAGAAFAGGVSIFGAGAGRVSIDGGSVPALALGAGAGARVRGVRLTGRDLGLRVEGASGLVVEEVAVESPARGGLVLLDTDGELSSILIRGVTGEPGHGLYAEGDSDVTIADTLVDANAGVGVVAAGATLDLSTSVVRANEGYGVAIQGGAGMSSMRATSVTENTVAGVLASATRLRIESSEVSATRAVDGLALLVSVQETADVEMAATNLHDSERYGVLVDNARLLMDGGECSGNEERAFWIQNVAPDRVTDGRSVLLDGVEVMDNGFAGVYGTKESAGLVIQNGIIGGTRILPVPSGGGTVRAGDGIHVTASAELRASEMTFDLNERAAAVFDGALGGVSDSVIRIGGGEEVGLVIQNGVPLDGFFGNTDGDGNTVDPSEPTTPIGTTAAEIAPAMPTESTTF